MKFVFTIAVLSLLTVQHVKAEIVCKSDSDIVVTIASNNVIVSGGALTQPEIYTNVQKDYDDHFNVFFTAPGLAISMKDAYGCLRNAEISTNISTSPRLFRTLKVHGCKGGSTPDSACGFRD